MSIPKSSVAIRGSIIECESITIRVAPGEYHNFPIVDNKGLFSHCRRTSEKYKFQLATSLRDEAPTFAIYKRVGEFSILVCAFASLEEINSEAMEIIKSNEKLMDSISWAIGEKNDKPNK
ncbi:hypothetical protein KD4_28390 [Yersinia pseudotuberculosis]|uniref:hypothetical protein n=1 Tax=Yersinia pseudotuberculosis TaxID=633 RepID=UPI0005E6969C|nr:hypothetical protein [Yersinia pseudotuberculosis]CNK99393.1 Uncharacterised protein [Yersinia pseudotuberculosis]